MFLFLVEASFRQAALAEEQQPSRRNDKPLGMLAKRCVVHVLRRYFIKRLEYHAQASGSRLLQA